MLVYTMKSIVTGFAINCPVEKITLTVCGDETKTEYKIVAHRNRITIDYTENDESKREFLTVDDFELYAFADKELTVNVFERETFQKGSEPYEYYRVFLDYPARLFIELFRTLKMRASFTIKHDGKFIDCYYISDKVRWREETEGYCNIHCSDLFKLNTLFPGYEIVTVSSPFYRHNFKSYMLKEENIAMKLRKPIRKYDNGVLFRGKHDKVHQE